VARALRRIATREWVSLWLQQYGCSWARLGTGTSTGVGDDRHQRVGPTLEEGGCSDFTTCSERQRRVLLSACPPKTAMGRGKFERPV
jgi:hypothetical protein